MRTRGFRANRNKSDMGRYCSDVERSSISFCIPVAISFLEASMITDGNLFIHINRNFLNDNYNIISFIINTLLYLIPQIR